MICKYCGATINDESNFCNRCGSKVLKPSKKPPQKIKKKKIIYKIIFLSTVLSILLIFALYFCMTSVEMVNKNIEAGSIITSKDIIKPRMKSATIAISGNVNTSALGKNNLRYTVQNGFFKRSKNFYINVVDTTSPKIVGPNSLVLFVGQKINLLDYYSVEDFEPNLNEKIVINGTVDTSFVGTKNLTLSVKDSSENEGKLSVVVKVLALTENEKAVLKVINQYIEDGNSKQSILSHAYILKAYGSVDGIDYYVEVANNVIYAITYSGDIYEFSVALCGGTTLHDWLLYAVRYSGSTVSTEKLLN